MKKWLFGYALASMVYVVLAVSALAQGPGCPIGPGCGNTRGLGVRVSQSIYDTWACTSYGCVCFWVRCTRGICPYPHDYVKCWGQGFAACYNSPCL